MSTQFNTKTDYSAHTDAHFDALYLAARRQHTEALRQAEMERLAHSVERCQGERPGHQGRTAAVVSRVAALITRKGQPTPGGTDN
jgi:hypothetical protein